MRSTLILLVLTALVLSGLACDKTIKEVHRPANPNDSVALDR